jgi:hypothetical protein
VAARVRFFHEKSDDLGTAPTGDHHEESEHDRGEATVEQVTSVELLMER